MSKTMRILLDGQQIDGAKVDTILSRGATLEKVLPDGRCIMRLEMQLLMPCIDPMPVCETKPNPVNR